MSLLNHGNGMMTPNDEHVFFGGQNGQPDEGWKVICVNCIYIYKDIHTHIYGHMGVFVHVTRG